MILTKKTMSQFVQAMAVIVLACLAFWVLAQKTEKQPAVAPSKLLLEQLEAFYSSGQFEETVRFADSISVLFEPDSLRVDWFKVIRFRTIAQNLDEHPRKALIQLLPVVQAQTLDDSITAKLYGLLGYSCLNTREFGQGAWYFERNLSGLLRHQCKSGIGFAYMNLGFALKGHRLIRAAKTSIDPLD